MQNHHPNFLIIIYGNYIKSKSSIQEYLPAKYSAFDLTFSMIKSTKTVRAD